MKNFSLKFLDIMIAIVLGFGFQWWPSIKEPWQYVAFIFVYIDIVDYWMDYGPSLKKFPPKKEIDVVLDVAIMFALFLYIYATQLTLIYFLSAFILTRILDFFWLLSSKMEYHLESHDKLYINSWLKFNLIEALFAACLIALTASTLLSPLVIMIVFVVVRFTIRILASLTYKKVHFA